MELTYTKVENYYIPDITIDDDTECEIGVYGQLFERFLKEHRSGIYTRRIFYRNLCKRLNDIYVVCHECIDFLISAMEKQDGMTEAIKTTDQME